MGLKKIRSRFSRFKKPKNLKSPNFVFYKFFSSHLLCNQFNRIDIQLWIAICGVHMAESLLNGLVFIFHCHCACGS